MARALQDPVAYHDIIGLQPSYKSEVCFPLPLSEASHLSLASSIVLESNISDGKSYTHSFDPTSDSIVLRLDPSALTFITTSFLPGTPPWPTN